MPPNHRWLIHHLQQWQGSKAFIEDEKIQYKRRIEWEANSVRQQIIFWATGQKFTVLTKETEDGTPNEASPMIHKYTNLDTIITQLQYFHLVV